VKVGTYLQKEVAATLLQRYDKSITSTMISDYEISLAETQVNAELITAGIDVPASSDPANLLMFATFLFLVDYMAITGTIAYTTGKIIQSSLGTALTRWGKENMFFFRSGNTGRQIQDLRDSQTPYQTARALIRAYITWYFSSENGSTQPLNAVKFDMTTDGYGSNVPGSVIIDADNESRDGDYS